MTPTTPESRAASDPVLVSDFTQALAEVRLYGDTVFPTLQFSRLVLDKLEEQGWTVVRA